jgi:hypothetical protein
MGEDDEDLGRMILWFSFKPYKSIKQHVPDALPDVAQIPISFERMTQFGKRLIFTAGC